MSEERLEPHLFVVLGGTGDLTRRKLLPALYHLRKREIWNEKSVILGTGRSAAMDDKEYRKWAREALVAAGFEAGELARWCDHCLYYQPVGEGKPQDYRELASRIQVLEEEVQLSGNRAFYLALPPQAFPGSIEGLGKAGLNAGKGWTRLVIEKPFGQDLNSAQVLNNLVHQYFEELQIYRIDHYLGKETVQNLLAFRFANRIFESLWNREHIDSVQITVAEALGVGARGSYYERSGALRDMVQNHLTQLLTLMAMETPVEYGANAIRDEKVKVLRAVRKIPPEQMIFAQYTRGQVGDVEAPGYREEEGIHPESETETYVALKLAIDNWRWQGVPFYLQTGKRLPSKVTEINVIFQKPPVCFFRSFDRCTLHANVLKLILQPDEGISLHFEVKSPGEGMKLKTQPLQFRYAEAFKPLPDAYETLLVDIVQGDQTLFVRADEVETSWQLFTPLLRTKKELHSYPAGTWGPPEGEELLEADGRQWHTH